MFAFSTRSATAATAMVALVVLLFSSNYAHARTFECEKVAAKNGKNVTLPDCVTDLEHMQELYLTGERLIFLIIAAIPLILAIFVFIIYPFICCGRTCCNCCCGGRTRNPQAFCCVDGKHWDGKPVEEKEALYTSGSRIRTKVCAFFVLIIGVVAMILVFFGASGLISAYNGLFDDALGLVAWVGEQRVGIRTSMTVTVANGTQVLAPPLTEQFFTDLRGKEESLRSDITNTKADLQQYVDYAGIASYVIAALPTLFFIVTALAAVANLRTCLLTCNNCFHWFFTFIYGIWAFIFIVLGVVFTDICGEREAFLANQTNIFSLHLVSECESSLPFSAARDEIAAAVVTNSRASCASMLEICSPGAIYNPLFPDEVYQCQGLTNATLQCNSLAEVSSFFDAMRVKTGSPRNCDLEPNNCTVRKCATQCPTPTKYSAGNASQNLDFAIASYTAFTQNIDPLMSCVLLITQVLRPLSGCSNFQDSFFFIGYGALIYTVFMTISMCVICRGQKRFFSPIEASEQTNNGNQPDWASAEPTSTNQLKSGGNAGEETSEYEEVTDDE